MRIFKACKQPVDDDHSNGIPDKGAPSDDFLNTLVDALAALPDEVFAPNGNRDIYTVLRSKLGPYASITHRRAVMAEALRVIGAFESDWHWNEGVDTTNARSRSHIEGQETGIFQVSFDSVAIDPSLAACVFRYCGGVSASLFIPAMKLNHRFAIEYAARLLRVSTRWDGPCNRGWVARVANRDAVSEFCMVFRARALTV